jgi:hypothetical protein
MVNSRGRAIGSASRGTTHEAHEEGSHNQPPFPFADEGYFGASTRIRVAVMVKVPLMLGMGFPFKS